MTPPTSSAYLLFPIFWDAVEEKSGQNFIWHFDTKQDAWQGFLGKSTSSLFKN